MATDERDGGGYDEQRLVELIGEGRRTYAEIAEELGISVSTVKKIASGRRRPDLYKRIWEAEGILLDEARRLGAAASRRLIVEQIRLGLSEEGESARRAREFVLKYAADHRPTAKQLPTPMDAAIEQEVAALAASLSAERERDFGLVNQP